MKNFKKPLGWWLWNIYGTCTVIYSGILVGLKLEGKIDWSWWLVFLPIWGNLAAALLFLAVCYAIVKLYGNEKNIDGNFEN